MTRRNPFKELFFGVPRVLWSEVIDLFTFPRARPAIFMGPVSPFDDFSTNTAWSGQDPAIFLLLSLLESSEILTTFHDDSWLAERGAGTPYDPEGAPSCKP